MANLKQFTGRRTSPQEHLVRALTSGTAQQRGSTTFWMPGFVPLEYLRATNRDRLGVTADDPCFPVGPTKGGQA